MEIATTTVFFFDMDGTLVNTDFANFLAYKAAISRVMGQNAAILSYNPSESCNRSWLRAAFPSHTDLEYTSIVQAKQSCYKDYLAATTIIAENVAILLKYAPTHCTVMVSNCRKERGLQTLAYHGLTSRFPHLFGRESLRAITSPKSNKTNKYQKAIELLAIPADKIVAFENEESEITDAIQAGITTIPPRFYLNYG